MKPSIPEDKNKSKKVEIEKQIATAKKLHSIHFSNFSLTLIPAPVILLSLLSHSDSFDFIFLSLTNSSSLALYLQVLDLSNLKLLDLGFNNIEELPLAISNLKRLE